MDKIALKCPVCGKVNNPVLFSADIGSRATVKMEYICSGKIKRLFRPGKSCETKYRVELYDESFFIGLTAERQVLTYKRGRPVYEWKIKDYKHKRNEALDCRNYAAAAIEIAQVPLKKKEEQPKPTKKRKKRRTSGGII